MASFGKCWDWTLMRPLYIIETIIVIIFLFNLSEYNLPLYSLQQITLPTLCVHFIASQNDFNTKKVRIKLGWNQFNLKFILTCNIYNTFRPGYLQVERLIFINSNSEDWRKPMIPTDKLIITSFKSESPFTNHMQCSHLILS